MRIVPLGDAAALTAELRAFDASAALDVPAFAWVLEVADGPVRVAYLLREARAAPALAARVRRAARRVRQLLAEWGQPRLAMAYTVVPRAAPRRWPTHGAQVAAQHINGGFTYRGGGASETKVIYILRKEEYPKVMLHEALHHTRAHAAVAPAAVSFLRATYAIHPGTPLLAEEGIIEAAATLAQARFVADACGLAADSVLERERLWAVQQARRLLCYQAHYYPQWQETTNAFAYLVVRALCLTQPRAFLAALQQLKAGAPVDWTAFFQRAHSAAHASWQKDCRGARPPTGSMRMTLFGDG